MEPRSTNEIVLCVFCVFFGFFFEVVVDLRNVSPEHEEHVFMFRFLVISSPTSVIQATECFSLFYMISSESSLMNINSITPYSMKRIKNK